MQVNNNLSMELGDERYNARYSYNSFGEIVT